MSKNNFENEMNEKMCKFRGRIVMLVYFNDTIGRIRNEFIVITDEED